MAEINLDLVTNVQKSIKEIENFSKQSAKSLEGVEKSFSGLSKDAKAFGESSAKSAGILTSALGAVKVAAGAAIALFAGRQIIDFFSDGIEAAQNQEKSIKTLNVALALSGDYSQKASEQFIEFADALENSTGFSDEQAIKLVALAKSFGATNEQAQKIVQTSVDFGTSGANVESTVEGLSKSLNGYKSSLSKTVPELQGLTKEQLKSGKAIDLISKKYENAASTLNKGFSGSISRVENNFEDLLKPIGALITKNPIIIASIDLFADALAGLADILVRNKKAIIEFSVAVFEGLGKTISDLIRGFSYLGDAFDGLQIVVAALAVGYANFASVAVHAASSVVSAFLKIGAIAIGPLVDQISELSKVLAKVGAISDETATSIQDIAKTIKTTGEDGVVAFKGTIESLDELKDKAEFAFEATVNGAGSSKKALLQTADATDKYFDSIVQAGRASLDTSGLFETLNRNADRSKQNFEEQAKAIEETTKSLEGLRGSLQKAADVKDPTSAIQREQNERLKIVENALRQGLVTEKEYADLKAEINIDAATQTATVVDKINKERLDKEIKRQEEFVAQIRKSVAEGIDSPLITSSQAASSFNVPAQGVLSPQDATTFGQVVGGLSSALEGQAGATKLLSGAVGTIAEVFAPGSGKAVTQIFEILSQGPDKVKELVQSFADALPEVFKNIGLAIPAVVETLTDNIDEIVIAIAKALPDIIVALVKSIPHIFQALLFDVIPNIARALVDEIQNAFSKEGLKSFTDTAAREFGIALADAAKFDKDFRKAAEGFGDEISKIGSSVSTSFNAIPQAATNFTNTIQNGVLSIRASLISAGTFFVQTIQQGIEVVRQAFISFGSTITNLLTSIGTGITNVLIGAFESIKGLFVQAADGLKSGVVSGITDSLKVGILDIFKGIKIALPSFSFPPFPAFKFPALPELKLPKLPTLDVNVKIPPIEIPSFEINIPGLDRITSKARSIIPGFADGGLVPAGFPNDTFPASLSSGEVVIDRSLTNRLESFLNNQGRDQAASPVKVVLQVGEKQLADVMLNINRQGFRTA